MGEFLYIESRKFADKILGTKEKEMSRYLSSFESEELSSAEAMCRASFCGRKIKNSVLRF